MHLSFRVRQRKEYVFSTLTLGIDPLNTSFENPWASLTLPKFHEVKCHDQSHTEQTHATLVRLKAGDPAHALSSEAWVGI